MKLKKIKLGDVLDVKRGTSLSGKYYDTTGTKIRLTLGNFNYPLGGFKNNTSKLDIYFNGPVKDEFILKKGDVITPLTEQVRGLLGETARIPDSDVYIQSGDIGLLIPNENKLDKSYMYHLISSDMIKNQLSKGAQQTKIRHTSPDKIKDCVAWIPDLNTQKQIGKFLDNIDSKIANNNAISKELESMAKTIYDYWFLQFEFPDKDGKPYKSNGGKMIWNDQLKQEIPEGWEVSTVKNILGDYPRTKTIESKEYGLGTLYPIIDQSKDTYICGYTNDKEKVLNLTDAIVFGDHSNKSKYVNFPFARGADGTQILNSNNPKLPNYLLYQEIISLPEIEKGYSRHFKFLKAQNVTIPTLDTAKDYINIVSNMLLQQREIIKENQQLQSLRDFLLPMLMNEQVTFDN
ncbi:restriction endonuclease subunit S [Lactobacillus johnsonii]|uniref:restriction endonuclease subunit S n=1 Tax=Lactobacillus johnsonii TaxID=33959 RepID=UPI00365B318C